MNKKIKSVFIWTAMLLTFALFPAIAQAATTTITVSNDGDIYTDSRISGGYVYAFTVMNREDTVGIQDLVGRSSSFGSEKSALSFDLTGIKGTVTSATLQLNVEDVIGTPVVNVFPTLDNWNERDPSVVNFPTNLGSIIINGQPVTSPGPLSIDVTDIIKTFVNGSYPKLGFVLTGLASPGDDDFSFTSNLDTGNPSGWARLIVTYTPPPNAPNFNTGATLTNSATPTLSWTSGGGGNGTYRYKMDDNNFNSGTTETTSTSYTPSIPLSDGSHALYLEEQNSDGLWSSYSSYGFWVDTAAPGPYSVNIGPTYINTTNKNAMSFSFSGAEISTTYNYSISSSGGGTPVTGSGYVGSATQTVSGIDVSSLPDGTLTLSATLTDPAGNTGSAATATVTKDTTTPGGYSVSIEQSNISAANKNAMSFTFSGAEAGTSYNYNISSSGGGTAVTGSGAVTSDSQTVSGIDVSGLGDGTLTVSFKLKDTAGNTGSAATATIAKDATPPGGYTVSFGQAYINAANQNAMSFQFSGAEVGSSYSYSISSSGGGTPITNSGTIVSASQAFSGINVSGLPDGTLTLAATLTDSYGNTGSTATKTVLKDTIVPTGYTVSIDQTSINASNKNALSFTFSGAEAGSSYYYTVTSSGGGSPKTGSGTVTSVNQQISGVDVSALPDGTLTLSVTLTDNAGNTGSTATTTATKDATAPGGYTVSIDQPHINSSNKNAMSFSFSGAEAGTTYNYSISSSSGGTPKTGSGAVTSLSQTVSGIDVSSLADGTLTLSVALTDTMGNTGNAATATVTKDATAPDGYGVSIDQPYINPSNKSAMSFSFSGAEIGTTFNYTISSSSGGTPITNTGTIVSASQAFSGIDVSGLPDGTLTLAATLTDSYGNTGSTAAKTVLKDTIVPAGYTVSMGQQNINASNKNAISFGFSGAEVGTSYNYSIMSSGGGTPVTGSGPVSSETQAVSGIDVSGLADGTLTLSVTLTDNADNTGSAAIATVSKDTAVPAGYTASIGQTKINSGNKTALSFTILGGETGTTYNYSISSSGGGTPVTASGRVGSAAQTVSGIDVSSLPDGTLTLSVTLTDSAGNTGSAATGMVSKDTHAPAGYTVHFDPSSVSQPNQSNLSFTLSGAETGALYTFSIDSSGGGSIVTGNGVVTSASQTVSGLDVSSLPDGTLTLSIMLTDGAGNTGSAATATVTKETGGPAGYSVHTSMPQVNSVNKGNLTFNFSGAEIGTTYKYTISSSGGGTQKTGNGTVTSSSQQVSGIDVSGLADGTLTVSVTLTDGIGNAGSPATVAITKDTVSSVYALTITAGEGGSVSSGGSYTAGCVIPISATAADGYRFDHWSATSGTFGSASNALTTYTMPAGPTMVTANFVSTRWQQTLTDNAGGTSSGASISGVIDGGATVAVGQMSLGSDPAATAIQQMTANSGYTMVFGQDISIQGGTFTGSLTITIPVGTQYNGLTATVLHDAHGTLETFTVPVAGGNVTFNVTSLSPFAVFLPVSASHGTVSVTADATQLYVGGRTILTPAIKGGTWQYDKSMVSLKENGNGTFTVTALKAGNTTLHYTVGWASADVALTIGARGVPQTGQDFIPVYILLMLAGCAMGTAVLFSKKRAGN